MTRYYNVVLLIAILFLGVCYGQQRATEGERQAELKASERRADSLASVSASLVVRVQAAEQRVREAVLNARAASVRRGRVVASSDSTLARVDSLLQNPTTEPCPCLQVLADLRGSLVSERLASDSVILSLESVVSTQSAQIVEMDRLLVLRSAQIANLETSLKVASRRPPWYARASSAALPAAAGALLALLLVR